jgi:ABC transport system ATP-binding/permease protein
MPAGGSNGLVILVDARRIGVSRPGRALFEDLSLTVSSGERLGVVGLNGTGKSTLLRVLAGSATPETGLVSFARDLRTTLLDQGAILPDGTARSIVGDQWEAAAVMDRLGVSPYADRPVSELSGGQRKRVALARALNGEFDLLILDEPTNHLDVDAIEWLQERLLRMRAALVLVTHDRHLLDAVTTKVLELDRGTGYVHVPTSSVHGTTSASAGSGYAAYLEGRALREEQAERDERTRRNLARSELAWLRRGAPARTSKPKARQDAARALIGGSAKAAARTGELELSALGSARLGSKVIELAGVGHRFDEQWLFRGLDVIIEPGERLGIVGPNGAGKTTLLDVIAGQLSPVQGTVEVGSTVRLGYYDQLGVELDGTQRVRDAVAGPLRSANWEDDALLERFWFEDDARYAPVGLLSGGERRRLQLVMTLSAQPNVLLLDEPTNDLDLDTLRALEDFCEDWPGALVVVSHDRAFMERTVEHALAIEDGRAAMVRGGMSGWLAARRARRSSPVPSASAVPRSAPTPRSASATPSAMSGGADSIASPNSHTLPATDSVPTDKSRSAYTLGRLLRDADKEMQRAVKQRDQVMAKLVSTTDHVALAELGRELAAAESALGASEDRWLQLAEEVE